MWLWFGIKKEFEKIKEAFEKRDLKIKEIENKLISEKEVKLMIKEAIIDLKVQFGALSEPKFAPKQKQGIKSFEKNMYQRAKKLRPDAIKQAIRGLLEREITTTDIFNEIVVNKNLCGKTQFYHYLSLVRSERSELARTKPNPTTKKSI